MPPRRFTSLKIALLGVLVVVFGIGCGEQVAQFEPNRLLLHRMAIENETSMDQIASDLAVALDETFGTPDSPVWPSIFEDEAFRSLDRPELLDRAAGPFGRAYDRVERGLFRKHCAHCHSLTGDGFGPTSYFQNPYPRDFRRGTFKFKSTPIGFKPTLDDLRHTIVKGIPGTAMPAFSSLAGENQENDPHGMLEDDDIDAIVHYVRYLSIRGEVERRLLSRVGTLLNLDQNERLYDVRLRDTQPERFAKQQDVIHHVVREVAKSWIDADQSVIPSAVPETHNFDLPKDLEGEKKNALLATIERGKSSFRGPTAACSLCHGKNGNGKGATPDFDEWTKDWTIRAGIDPKDRSAWKPMKKLGALAPRRTPPRNFEHGVFRGGASPEAIYRRIVGGIEGSAMPAVPLSPGHPQGLTSEQVWDIVTFVRAIPWIDADGAPSSAERTLESGSSEKAETKP